jgi:hypothetical protein
MIREEAEKILKYESRNNRNRAYVKYKNYCNTCNNKDNCKHHKILQKTSEQHNWRARRQRITENRHIRHCAHTSESANVKVQNI